MKAAARFGLAVASAAVLIGLSAQPAFAADAGGSVALGAYIPEADRHPSLIDRYARQVGRSPVIVSYYKQWDFKPFVPAELNAIWSRGAVPMVTWEAQSYLGREYPLRLIQRGRFDRYIRKSARAAAAWGRPILVRFLHEMNGTWYPWSRGIEGNNSYRLKAVWRRVVRIFRTQGADNVEWVWTPNVNTGGDFPFRDLYPGDAWVDWVGLDGFNWAQRGEWNSFTDIVDNTYEELAKISSRPMIVAETGSNETGGDKAAWVTSALRREIPKLGRIRAVVWFDDEIQGGGAESDSGLDARVNSSRASLRAFRSAIAAPQYALSRSELLATPANTSGNAVAPSPPSGEFGEPSLFYRITHKLHGRYLWYAIGIALAGLLVLIGGFVLVRQRLRARTAR
ncbi:MAG TPA: glycosyl hydrolase [Solirubrobacterales bacterium]|nr:glycosyl hydrolase [Solirubrobacterales bacterium]